LAAEIKEGGNLAAAKALMMGSSSSSSNNNNNISSSSTYRSILDIQQHQSKAMTTFRQDNLAHVREQFFNGELPNPIQVLLLPSSSSSSSSSRNNNNYSNENYQKTKSLIYTPQERFYHIDSRLRRVIVKACQNSYAASKVINILEDYLIAIHTGKEDTRTLTEWLELLLEPPTVISRRRRRHRHPPHNNNKNQTDQSKEDNVGSEEEEEEVVTRFLFDADSSTGGFHRLLLHGVCQYHGLRAVSSTTMVSVVDNNNDNNNDDGNNNRNVNVQKKARVLTSTGVLLCAGTHVGLVDFVTNQQGGEATTTNTTWDHGLENETCHLAALQQV
jgi:hypothetical protein